MSSATPGLQAIEAEIDEMLRLQGEDVGELLLVRHAASVNGQGNDPMLTCAGLAQAERLALRLSETGFEAVYAAPERRAQQTSRVIAGASGRALQILDGPADIEFDAARASRETPLRYADRFAELPRWDSLPGFECSKSFRRRTVQTIERVLSISQARRVVVVTHGSVINAYLSMVLSIPADQFVTVEPASISTVRWREGRYGLRCLNDLSHLSLGLGMAAEAQLFTPRS